LDTIYLRISSVFNFSSQTQLNILIFVLIVAVPMSLLSSRENRNHDAENLRIQARSFTSEVNHCEGKDLIVKI